MWYGYVEFKPEDNGSEPFTTNNPHIRALATQNAFSMEFSRGMDIDSYWKFYKENKDKLIPSKNSIEKEAQRLCDECYNNHWSHHLSQEDVDALVKNNRLMDFTHTCTKGKGWEPKNPPYHPTAKEVNEWSLSGMGHDSINNGVCIRARCEKENVSDLCPNCEGNGTIWESRELEKKADEWKEIEPPSGPFFQIWENVSEGSPVSPAFEKPEDLAMWMIDNDRSITKNTTYQQWIEFITNTKYAPSFVMKNGVIKSGVEA